MTKLLKLVSPFKKLTETEKWLSTGAVIFILLGVWTLSGSAYLPRPLEIIKAFPRLVGSKDLLFHFHKSLFFCFKAILYSSTIALILCYLSVLPLFTTFCQFLRKFRFLPSTGLSFLFMKMTGNINDQMLWMMVFGVTTWLTDSMIGVALSITNEEIMYARSLRLSKWQTMKEILILGKASKILECIIANFAMAWMLLAAIENIAKANGGIGVVLAESNKYYKFAEVYSIQILILTTGIIVDFLLNKLKGFLFPYTNLKN